MEFVLNVVFVATNNCELIEHLIRTSASLSRASSLFTASIPVPLPGVRRVFPGQGSSYSPNSPLGYSGPLQG